MINERELWSGLQDGDEKSLTAIYELYYQHLFNFGFRISLERELTKDCIHEMFTKLWKNKENLSEVLYPKAYLMKYLNRLILAQIKSKIKEQKKNFLYNHHADLIFDYENSLLSEEALNAQKKSLSQALTLLSPRQQQIIQLRFYEGFDYKEIAKITALKPKTVYNLSHEAIKSLREIMISLAILHFLESTHLF